MAKTEARFTIGDTGLALEVLINDQGGSVVDISGATAKRIRLRGPDKVTRDLAGTFFTDGTDGKLRYVTLVTTLNLAGPWEIWAHITTASQAWATSKKEFIVNKV